jgi:hypothetical protein
MSARDITTYHFLGSIKVQFYCKENLNLKDLPDLMRALMTYLAQPAPPYHITDWFYITSTCNTAVQHPHSATSYESNTPLRRLHGPQQ